MKIFEKTNHLNFTLLSDVSGEIMSKFGVPVGEGGTISKDIDGKEIQLHRGSTALRWTFIFDPQGKLISIDKEVKATEDSKNVLNFLKSQ